MLDISDHLPLTLRPGVIRAVNQHCRPESRDAESCRLCQRALVVCNCSRGLLVHFYFQVRMCITGSSVCELDLEGFIESSTLLSRQGRRDVTGSPFLPSLMGTRLLSTTCAQEAKFAKEERQSSNDTQGAVGVPSFSLQELSGPCLKNESAAASRALEARQTVGPLWRSAAKVFKDGSVVWLRAPETRLAASPRGAAQPKTSKVSPSVRQAGVPAESWE